MSIEKKASLNFQMHMIKFRLTIQYQTEESWQCISVFATDIGGIENKMDNHSTNNCCHQGCANKKGIPRLQCCVRCKFKNEILAYPCDSPHEQVAAVHKYMQTYQSIYTA